MLGRLGEGIRDGWIGGSPSPGAAELVDALRARVQRRVREVLDLGRIATALEWLRDFRASTGRILFVPLAHAGDIAASIHNAETFELYAEYIRTRGSRQRGREGTTLASDTVDGYVSAVRVLRGVEAHYAVTIPITNTVASLASKRTRQGQGPQGERKLKRGIRAQHLRALADMGYDRTSARGMLEWAAALGAHNLLLRGGELGVVEGKAFDPKRDCSFGAFEFRAPCRDSAGMPWLIWHTVPVKDTVARRRVCPMAVRRRSQGARGADPLCTYDAIVMAWVAQTGSEPPATGSVDGPLAAQPFFTAADGSVWDTGDTRRLAQAMGAALGIPESEVGGSSLRIGGATDWREVFGADAERIIKQRGRWYSDIGYIYQRALAEAHLRGSAAVGSTCGADLESMCRGWVQPATFR